MVDQKRATPTDVATSGTATAHDATAHDATAHDATAHDAAAATSPARQPAVRFRPSAADAVHAEQHFYRREGADLRLVRAVLRLLSAVRSLNQHV